MERAKLSIRVNKASWEVYLSENHIDGIDYLDNMIRVCLKGGDVRKRLLRMLIKVIHYEYEDEIREPENIDVLNAVDRILGATGIEI